MTEFGKEIEKITNEVLEDGTVENIIRQKVVEGFEKAISDSFAWGSLNKAIKNKVDSVLVPYIENYDMGKQLVKLDTILTEIVNVTSLQENKKILENFKSLMTVPTEKTIKASELFKQYNDYVARNIETEGRDTDCDTGMYVSVRTGFTIEIEEDNGWQSYIYSKLELFVEDEEEDTEESLNKTLRLSRWKNEKKDGWRIRVDTDPSISSLRYLDKFEVFLLQLERADVRIIFDEYEDFEDVTPENEPD